MLVLITILVPIANVEAKSFTTDNNAIVPSNIHDYFRYYFGEEKSYQYFPYSCTYGSYTRTCYYGIDKEGNYLDIKYQGSDYSYNQISEFGVNETFSVTGKNIFKVNVSNSSVITTILVFVFVFIVFWLMLGVI